MTNLLAFVLFLTVGFSDPPPRITFVNSGILVKQVSDRIASQTIAARAASVAPSISHNHKWLLLIAQRPRFGTAPSQDTRASIPKRRRHNTTFSTPNVPLQTREHALAGISGMLRSLAGAQGAYTSRGAKPKGLNLMLLGLTSQTKNKRISLTSESKNITSTSLCVCRHHPFASVSLCAPISLTHTRIAMMTVMS